MMTRIVFMGSPDFALPSLARLIADGYAIVGVYTQPDREAGRGRALTPPPVKALAREAGLPVFQPERLRGAAVEDLRTLRPDLLVVAAYGQMLRRAVLEIAPFGALNVHASLLPRWRGASPVQAAILAGDAETGVSIMRIDEGLDTGPVLSRQATPILDADNAGTLADRLALMGADLLSATLPGWLAGTIPAVDQDDALATYAPKIEKDAGRLDWTRPAVVLWRQVRAFNPRPGTFTSLRGASLRILNAWPLAGGAAGVPGTVAPLSDALRDAVPAELPRAAFAVQTGDGLLVPLKLQRAGKRALFAEEFLRGERDLIGQRLGEV